VSVLRKLWQVARLILITNVLSLMKSWRKLVQKRISCVKRLMILNFASSHVFSRVLSVSERMLVMVLAWFMSLMRLVVVASARFHHSVSLISRCIKRLSFVSIAAVSLLIQNLQVLRLTIRIRVKARKSVPFVKRQ